MPAAARLTDSTTHGGVITEPGAPSVLIGYQPAARITDLHTCPMSTGGAAHVGGPVTSGESSVLIEYQPAAREGDEATCTGATDTISSGELVKIHRECNRVGLSRSREHQQCGAQDPSQPGNHLPSREGLRDL